MLLKSPRKKMLNTPSNVTDVLRAILKGEDRTDRDKEHVWAIGLTTRNLVKYIELVSLGVLTSSLVHPREVFRTAISKAVSSIIVAHNHPSGDHEPSEEDLKITRRLVEAGRVIGIEVLDHIIVASNGYTSFKERGFI